MTLEMRVGRRVLSNGGKSNECDRSVSGLSDFKSLAAAAGFGVCCCLFLLQLELGNFRLQFPNVSVGGFVFLRLVDLSANHFDLLFDRRQAEPSCVGAWLALLEGSYEEPYLNDWFSIVFSR